MVGKRKESWSELESCTTNSASRPIRIKIRDSTYPVASATSGGPGLMWETQDNSTAWGEGKE